MRRLWVRVPTAMIRPGTPQRELGWEQEYQRWTWRGGRWRRARLWRWENGGWTTHRPFTPSGVGAFVRATAQATRGDTANPPWADEFVSAFGVLTYDGNQAPEATIETRWRLSQVYSFWTGGPPPGDRVFTEDSGVVAAGSNPAGQLGREYPLGWLPVGWGRWAELSARMTDGGTQAGPWSSVERFVSNGPPGLG